jgi:hypothetical protein
MRTRQIAAEQRGGPSMLSGGWMRKPGDPDYEEDQGETGGGQVHVLNRS